MKNIIPFKKDVIFKTNLSEVTSISLENTLSIDNDKVSGDFIISGEYKISDSSTTVEPFNLNIPFEIIIDERYDTKRAVIDIDDFYYEIINNNVLSVSIDVLIDKLEDKPLIEMDDLVDVTPTREILSSNDEIQDNLDQREEKESIEDKKGEEKIMTESVDRKEETIESSDIKEDVKSENIRENEKEIVEEKINSLFNQFSSDSEVYVTYNVFILRDGDNLDTIMEKYGITEEELKKYNDISNLQLGDKLIIPNTYERN